MSRTVGYFMLSGNGLFRQLKYKLENHLIENTKITVISDSMAPFINIGDKVEITCFKENELKVGDVILYMHWQYTATLHRISEILEDGRYLTKGDNNDAPDPYLVTNNDIIGIVKKYKETGNLT